MSVLTKVFVVLVAILSVVLVALIVPFVANTQRFQDQITQVEAEKQAAEATARMRQNELQAIQNAGAQDRQNLQNARQALEERNRTLMTQLAEAQAEVQLARAGSAKWEADLGRLAAAEQQNAEMVKSMSEELAERRPGMVKLQTQLIQVSDRNNELASQVEALNRLVRRSSEQVTQLSERNVQLEDMLARVSPEERAVANGGAGTGTPFEPETPIEGAITAVQPSEDATFVQVNVGRNDGVEENMKFLVHRNGTFLGTLVITAVDAKASAGRLQFQQGEIKSGDAVLTGGF